MDNNDKINILKNEINDLKYKYDTLNNSYKKNINEMKNKLYLMEQIIKENHYNFIQFTKK